MFAPLEGWRRVKVTDRRTALITPRRSRNGPLIAADLRKRRPKLTCREFEGKRSKRIGQNRDQDLISA
jgi:hypothetical protein